MADFSHLNRKELRAYALAHRDDEEALRVYMDRLHNDSDVRRQSGDCSEEGLAKLKQLIEEASANPPNA